MNEAEARADTARKLAERMKCVRLNSPQRYIGLFKNEIMSRLPLPEIIPGLRCASKTFGGFFEQITDRSAKFNFQLGKDVVGIKNSPKLYFNIGKLPSSTIIQKLLCKSAVGSSKMWMRGDTMTSCIPMNSSAGPQSVCITMKVIKPSLNSRGILLDGKINPVYKHLMIDIIRYKIANKQSLNLLSMHTMRNDNDYFKAFIGIGSYDDVDSARRVINEINRDI
ncbi:hypothetical protein AYI68_g6287 [Smittium mucronatum]|uniref:Uncharacterized protein n=1 Tax=Smittium mucronatum TaxID=133383 RepID=A0A1R0GRV8_9FUNG|nr:hypothetical protein AYI68_g6287 [Smittium mucronatum]